MVLRHGTVVACEVIKSGLLGKTRMKVCGTVLAKAKHGTLLGCEMTNSGTISATRSSPPSRIDTVPLLSLFAQLDQLLVAGDNARITLVKCGGDLVRLKWGGAITVSGQCPLSKSSTVRYTGQCLQAVKAES